MMKNYSCSIGHIKINDLINSAKYNAGKNQSIREAFFVTLLFDLNMNPPAISSFGLLLPKSRLKSYLKSK